MVNLNRPIWGALAVCAVLAPRAAPAQTIATSFTEVQRVLKKGQTILVTDTGGTRSKGKVAEVSPSSLVIVMPEARTFTAATLSEIRRTDSIRNGTLIGAVIGVGVGVAGMTAMCADGPDCGPALSVVAMTAGIGAAIGAGIDAFVGKGGKVLYQAPQGTRRLRIAPLIGRDAKGISGSMSF